jgi:hypothetical protein
MAASGNPLKQAEKAPAHEGVVDVIKGMRQEWMLRGGASGSFSDFVPKDDYDRRSVYSKSVAKLNDLIAGAPAGAQPGLQEAVKGYGEQMKSHHDNLLQGLGFDQAKFDKDNAEFSAKVNQAKTANPTTDDKQKQAMDDFNKEMGFIQKQAFDKEMQRMQATLSHQQLMQAGEAAYRSTEKQYGEELAAKRQFTKLTGDSPQDNAEMQKHNRNIGQDEANKGNLKISSDDFSAAKGGYGIYNVGDTGYQINYSADKGGGGNIACNFKTPQKSLWQNMKSAVKDFAVTVAVGVTAPISLPILLVASHYGFKMGPAAEKQFEFKEGFKMQMDFLAQKTNSKGVQFDLNPEGFSKFHVENMFHALQAAKERAGYDPSKTPPVSNAADALTFKLSSRLEQTFQSQTGSNMLTSDAVKMIKALGFNKDDYKDAMYQEIEKFNAAVLNARAAALTNEAQKDFQNAVKGTPGGAPGKYEVNVEQDGPAAGPKGKYEVQVESDGPDGPETKGKFTVNVEGMTNEEAAERERYASGAERSGPNLGGATEQDADAGADADKTAGNAVHVGQADKEDVDSALELDDIDIGSGPNLGGANEPDPDADPEPERPRGP